NPQHEEFIKEIQEQISNLMKQNEQLSETFKNLEQQLIEKDNEIQKKEETIKNLQKQIDSKEEETKLKDIQDRKSELLEKCIDEIFMEIQIPSDVEPTQMNPREKAILIVKSMKENEQELEKLKVQNERLQSELNELKLDKDIEEIREELEGLRASHEMKDEQMRKLELECEEKLKFAENYCTEMQNQLE